MKKSLFLSLAAISAVFALSSCTPGERGAFAGGAIGAGTGALIGDETGALVGGAIGAIAGSEIAKNRAARNYYYGGRGYGDPGYYGGRGYRGQGYYGRPAPRPHGHYRGGYRGY